MFLAPSSPCQASGSSSYPPKSFCLERCQSTCAHQVQLKFCGERYQLYGVACMLSDVHTLRAIDAMQVCAVHMSLISQLERLGGLEEWALYVALHLPNGAQGAQGSARDDLVLQLLHRHAHVWATSKEKHTFLTQALDLPPAWLASSLATLAAYNKDAEGGFSSAPLFGKCEDFDCRVPRYSQSK